MDAHDLTCEELGNLAEVLRGATGLRLLTVSWLFRYVTPNQRWGREAMRMIEPCGRRHRSDREGEGQSTWEELENILEPLKMLRGLKHASISKVVLVMKGVGMWRSA